LGEKSTRRGISWGRNYLDHFLCEKNDGAGPGASVKSVGSQIKLTSQGLKARARLDEGDEG